RTRARARRQLLDSRYRVGTQLGEGLTSIVYAGLDERDGRGVAIGIVRPELATDVEFVARFERDTQMLCQLQHPHLVRTLASATTDGGTLYVVSERLTAPRLDGLLTAEQRLAWPRVLEIIEQSSSCATR